MFALATKYRQENMIVLNELGVAHAASPYSDQFKKSDVRLLIGCAFFLCAVSEIGLTI